MATRKASAGAAKPGNAGIGGGIDAADFAAGADHRQAGRKVDILVNHGAVFAANRTAGDGDGIGGTAIAKAM